MRKTALAFLAVVAVSFAACKTICRIPDGAQFNNPCLSQKPPTVCIDPKTLHASQESLHVHGGDTAHFFITDGDGTLTITYDPKGVIEYVRHEGAHVWVKTMPVKETVHVPYTIKINGRRLDPEMVIEP